MLSLVIVAPVMLMSRLTFEQFETLLYVAALITWLVLYVQDELGEDVFAKSFESAPVDDPDPWDVRPIVERRRHRSPRTGQRTRPMSAESSSALQ